MGALGPAMIFVCLLLLETLLGIMVLTYAARCFGVIVEGTAAGNDAVDWPDEPMFDWLGRAAHLLFLLALVFVPGGMIGRILVRMKVELPPGGAFLPAFVLFWALFPVIVLSSFSATSRWVVLRPALLGGLFKVFPATAAFYFLSALLLGALGALGFFTFTGGMALLVPVFAAAAAAGVFVYARLLGRLGWALGQLERDEPEEEEAEEKPPARPGGSPNRPRKKRRPARRIETVDPWAVPEEEPAPPTTSESAEAYGVLKDEPAPKPRPPRRPERQPKKKPRPKGYAVSPEEPPPRPKETPLDGYLPVGADAEEDEAERDADRPRREGRTGRRDRAEAPREVPEPPAHPFLQGVYTFPWYSSSLGAWLVLAGGFLALGLVALAMLSLGGQLT